MTGTYNSEICQNKNFIYNLKIVSIDTITSIIKMLTKTQNEILKFLLRHQNEQHTIRSIARKLGRSYTLVYNNIADLGGKSIIKKNNVPPAQIVSINDSIPLQILVDIELKIKYEFLKKYPWIELMLNDILSTTENPFFIFIVFGSYARGEQTRRSDIDILVIAQTKDQAEKIKNSCDNLYTKVKKNIVVARISDLIEMTSKPREFNVGNEAIKNHIILQGVEQYYQIVRK